MKLSKWQPLIFLSNTANLRIVELIADQWSVNFQICSNNTSLITTGQNDNFCIGCNEKGVFIYCSRKFFVKNFCFRAMISEFFWHNSRLATKKCCLLQGVPTGETLPKIITKFWFHIVKPSLTFWISRVFIFLRFFFFLRVEWTPKKHCEFYY